MNKTIEKKISLFDFLNIFIIITSSIAIIFLSFGIFKVNLVIILSILLNYLIYHIRFKNKFYLNINDKKHTFLIIVLILVALFFRSEPYKYIIGGQDQGVYVNMSKAFKTQGQIFQYDNVRNHISDKNLKILYDQENLKYSVSIPRKVEGSYLPGVYIADQENSKYVFQFYHLHPLWMAIFDSTFGEENAGYSLIFFSIISIIAFYLLTFEISQNRMLSFMAGFLLAVNPLHAFFSKFPVTEVMALSFTLGSFYYLLRYFNFTKKQEYYTGYLILSALLMACMFFTKMSGFMYMPFFYVLLIVNQLFTKEGLVKFHLNIYIYSIFVLYILSVFYGLTYSFPYVHDMYAKSFSRLFGTNNYMIELLVILLALLLFLFFVVYANDEKSSIIKKYLELFRRMLPYLLMFMIVISLYKVYSLGFTDAYLDINWRFKRWNVALSGWEAFLHWSPVVLIQYLSPFMGVIFIISVSTMISKANTIQTLLFVFLIFFFSYILLLQWFIPYQYYYARYLLSETLPYTLLFSVVGYSSYSSIQKIFFYSFLLLAVLYSLYFTTLQLQGNVASGAYGTVKQITKNIGGNDLILMEKGSNSLKTALVYYENKNVFSFAKINLDYVLTYNLYEYDDIFILSKKIYTNKAFNLENEVTYTFGLFKHKNIIPQRYVKIKIRYYLYKVNKIKFIEQQFQHTKTINIKSWKQKEGFFTDDVWTNKTAKIFGFTLDISKENFLKLNVYGYNSVYKYDILDMGLEVYADGDKLTYLDRQDESLFFDIKDKDSIHEITIKTKIFIPKNHNMNNDSRKLGIDLKSIEFTKRK